MTYYIWHDEGCCDNTAADMGEALRIKTELLDDGHSDVYITNDDGVAVDGISLTNLPEMKHPFTNYTLAEAVDLAINNAKVFGRRIPETLSEVRKYIEEMAVRSGHNWLTGAAALDLLDAAIDNKEISKSCRFC